MANGEQAQAWNGDDGRHFIAEQARLERMHQPLTARLLSAAAIEATDVVLDVGCGCGGTTRAAARAASAGYAMGVDLSAPMLAEARRLAEADGVANARFEEADAQTCRFGGAYEVVISRFGVMFFDDPTTAFANIADALRPGGRLAFLCWREARENEFFALPYRVIAAHVPVPTPATGEGPGPFSLAEPDRVRDLLSSAGFRDIGITALDEKLRVGDDVADVVGYYRGTALGRSLLGSADLTTIGTIEDALAEALRPHQNADGIRLGSATWLVTARRPAA